MDLSALHGGFASLDGSTLHNGFDSSKGPALQSGFASLDGSVLCRDHELFGTLAQMEKYSALCLDI